MFIRLQSHPLATTTLANYSHNPVKFSSDKVDSIQWSAAARHGSWDCFHHAKVCCDSCSRSSEGIRPATTAAAATTTAAAEHRKSSNTSYEHLITGCNYFRLHSFFIFLANHLFFNNEKSGRFTIRISVR